MALYTEEELLNFEEDIAKCFDEGLIRAPVHLYSNNEKQMIDVFNHYNIGPDDWVFCTWRSHYQCLLKGVPKEELKQAIMDGKSISLSFPEYNVLSSAIVTGNLPIALGAALAKHRDGSPGTIYAFCGDMTAETGIFHECLKYANNFKLPIKFIIEDNGHSVCTDTKETWGKKTWWQDHPSHMIYYYKYKSKWPHAGAGKRVQF